ncbi:HlyD family efflux transporter periplasmic adaptor subunit [Parashewanella spongiae]|uniref:HlyD family efflux transporter periplasmic adaptor subunit n=1 Tax=Parashewanella spongiae TaxID=342950 RepID=A0A3A6UG08_9GAMM|nr:HlyD family efflux transporter periplasmic adaptor subunit [Parashewanella spongiae]MCL1078121.1 efflux RND transporter periplasmic adaptor subunit [Parashewanella spongiae]RJY16368.1 HlyD family efflux transporter periplasmic adaptor subunit [Parashewanella spongiae]
MIQDTSGQDSQVKPSTRQKFKRPLIAVAIAMGVITIAWASFSSETADKSVNKADLRLATLTRGTLTRDIASTGKIVAANAPVLYSTEAGIVTLKRNPGDRVKKDQVLAIITSPTLTNRLQQQRSIYAGLQSELERTRLNARRDQLTANRSLDIAQVELDAAERENRRGELLIKDNLISQIDYEKNKDDLNRAQLQHAHAQKEVALMKDTLAFEVKNKTLEVERQGLEVAELERQVEELAIKAPVDGIIGNWLTEQKARIAASQPILTVVDLTAFEAELSVPESYADELGIDMDVELNFGGKLVMGTLSSISPEVRNREVTTRVRFEQNPQLALRQNQRLSARVLLENKPNVLMVKRGAFINSSGGRFTFQVAHGMASKTNIKLGARSMSHVEVVSGGKEGDVWIVSDLERFKKSERIRIR